MSQTLPLPRAPQASLGRILERLGSTLLSLEAGPLDASRPVTTVVMHDAIDPPRIDVGAVVLGVGIVDRRDLLSGITSFAAAGAVAIVIREPVPATADVVAAAHDAGIAIFGLVRGASWIQIATMVAGALSMDTADADLAAIDTGTDLFALANSLAALLQAPITIEDLSSRVVAFSADQAGTDEGRRLTILGLQVPQVYNDVVRERGVFRQVYTSDRPVFMTETEAGQLPRVAIRVRAGEEVLGSIWAVVTEPLTPQREQGMVEAARVVALTMLRARVSADSTQRLRIGLVSMLLEGGARGREAANQLGFGSSPACVIAFGAGEESGDQVRAEAETQRIASALSMYLRPIYPRATAAPLGRIIYAAVPLRSMNAGAEAIRLAEGFISRIDTPVRLFAGVGDVVADISALPDSRRDADAALRVLCRPGDPIGVKRVTDLPSVHVEALMLRVADAVAGDRIGLSGPLATLREYDVAHGTELTRTLRSWLESFGDVNQAAASVQVHKNTFRYRLARLCELSGLDLGDSDTRFSLMLQLRLFDLPRAID